MKRRFSLAMASASLLLALSPHAARAGDYRSRFGFEISVPEVWFVLTRSEVADHADEVLGTEKGDGSESSGALNAIPAEIRTAVFDRIEKGELEIFYRREEAQSGNFVDNVNIMRQSAPFPSTREQLIAICRVLPREFSRVFGRPIVVDGCEMRDLFGRRALYLQFDGAVPGTKSMQYQLEVESGGTVVLTATVAMPHLSRMMSEFEAMVASIRFHGSTRGAR